MSFSAQRVEEAPSIKGKIVPVLNKQNRAGETGSRWVFWGGRIDIWVWTAMKIHPHSEGGRHFLVKSHCGFSMEHVSGVKPGVTQGV